MCLTSKKADVVEFLAKNKGKEFIKVFKILRKEEGYSTFKTKLNSPFQGTEYKAGEYDFSDEIKKNNRMRNNTEVSHGFHCYTNRQTANIYKGGGNKIVVPMYVKPEDILGLKNYHAVFKRAIFLKKDYEKAVN